LRSHMTQPTDSSSVRHEPDASRFVIDVPGGLAIARYKRTGDTMVLVHTEVPESAEGEGVGSALARAALDHARREGLRVVPRCPFMASYIRRHPEYGDLVEGADGS